MEVIKDVGLEDMIEKLPDGIYTQLGEHGDKLSGGQRQRISIARALIRKPKIIVFDEATSALDSASEKKVQEATSNMMKNCTTFLVAHRLSTIRNADRIVAMRDGKIVEVGSYDELMEKKGYFYELKALQSCRCSVARRGCGAHRRTKKRIAGVLSAQDSATGLWKIKEKYTL